MTTEAAADMAVSARRAVVRSEKFMEWQQKLSSTRAAYGGRGRYDAVEAAAISNGVKEIQRKRRHEEPTKRCTGSEEREVAENPVLASAQADNTKIVFRDKVKKQKQQQQQQQHCQKRDSKRPLKEANPDLKKVVLSGAKVPSDLTVLAVESARLRKCKGKQAVHTRAPQDDGVCQRTEQQACPTHVTNRRRRRMPTTANQDLQPSKRTETVLEEDQARCSKRSRETARVLANEEPHPPPLKLPKFHLVLTRNEILEDWLKITGQKYSGKPRKSALVQLGLGLCTSLTRPSTIRYLKDPQ